MGANQASTPFAISSSVSIRVRSSEIFQDNSTEFGAEIHLSEDGGKTERLILRMPLAQTPFNLAGRENSGIHPRIWDAKVYVGKLMILFSSTVLDFGEDGHFLVLERAPSGQFSAQNKLTVTELFPAQNSTSPQPPKEAVLKEGGVIHIVHHDDFAVDIRVSPTNVVSINGRPCSPDNAPVRRIHYRHFLHALSPSTAQTYDIPLPGPKEITWWKTPFPPPPYTLETLLDLSGLFDYLIPPKALTGAANASPAGASNPWLVVPLSTAKPVETNSAAPSEQTVSTPRLVWGMVIAAAIGLLWLVFKKRRG